MSNSRTEWEKHVLKPGEVYAGLILGQKGEKDYHLILLPGDAKYRTFKQAQEFAKKAGVDLPTRREQSLLFANCKDQFQSPTYWSGEQHAEHSAYAWTQGFKNGYQTYHYAYDRFRTRAVRRIYIEEQP